MRRRAARSAVAAVVLASGVAASSTALAGVHTGPRVLLSAGCRHGLIATLSNLDGLHRARFHVTGPGGHTTVVSVRPDAAKRVFFAVRRGETGRVHVTVAGSGHSLRWTNRCGK